MSEGIRNQAVALRLLAGSEEAGYLAQIFPLPKTPTVVIIKNGDLKEYITPPITKDEFIRRIQGSFGGPSQVSAPSTASPAAAPPAEAAASPDSLQGQTSENVRRILAERAQRLQAQRDEAERKVKEERQKAQEKARAEAEAGERTHAAETYKQAEMVKKKKKQQQEERQRILQRIEDDKAERKLRAAEREKQRIENQKVGDVASSLVHAPETRLPSTSKVSDRTALQVRLFDGSTIRSRFQTKDTLKEVRKWVDEKRHDGNLPYTFKQVLTPLPNKNIDATEEQENLGHLGLAPSSTLVLVPVVKYSTAYDRQAGIFSRLLGLFLGFFAWLLSLVGLGPRPAGHSRTRSQDSSFADRRRRGGSEAGARRRDQQLYNGNSVSHLEGGRETQKKKHWLTWMWQLNFEPRPEEEER